MAKKRRFRSFWEDEDLEDEIEETEQETETEDEEEGSGEEEIEEGEDILGKDSEETTEQSEETDDAIDVAGELEADEDVQDVTSDEGGSDDDNPYEDLGGEDRDTDVNLIDISDIVEEADKTEEEIEAISSMYPDVSDEQVGMFNEPFTTLPDDDGDLNAELLHDDDDNGEDYENTTTNQDPNPSDGDEDDDEDDDEVSFELEAD